MRFILKARLRFTCDSYTLALFMFMKVRIYVSRFRFMVANSETD